MKRAIQAAGKLNNRPPFLANVVQILAGHNDEVDEDTRKRVRHAAQILLDQLTFMLRWLR